MSKSELFLHLREQIRDAQTVSDCDHIIETAYSEYIKDNLSGDEYGKIYFAAIRRINEIESATYSKFKPRRVGVTVARQALNL